LHGLVVCISVYSVIVTLIMYLCALCNRLLQGGGEGGVRGWLYCRLLHVQKRWTNFNRIWYERNRIGNNASL